MDLLVKSDFQVSWQQV